MKNLEMYDVQELSPVEIKEVTGGNPIIIELGKLLLGGLFGLALSYADWSSLLSEKFPSEVDDGNYSPVCDNV